jgi:Amino acid permease
VFVFVACLGIAMGIGLVRTWHAGGHPHAVLAPPVIPPATATVGTWVLLAAFANGCTAMTGIEAVSNGVPLFRRPTVPNAHGALTAIATILGSFLLGLAYLCPAYRIGAMDERAPGYQTILSQLVAAVAGRGAFYYVSLASIFIVLTYSAQTSFADFPRVCRLLAEDRFLPPAFANRGRRLVYSHGIVVLSIVSALLFMAFGGVTDALIPLFAVGAFAAFFVSQVGMVAHWLKRPGPRVRLRLTYNALGAVTTSAALVVIVLAKFLEGAWMTVVFAPALVFLLFRIRRHYDKVARQVDQPLALRPVKLQPPVVIVPIDGWNRAAEKALRLGLSLSDDVTAVHVSTEEDDETRLRAVWADKVEKPAGQAKTIAVPRLEVLRSPYRRLYQPVLEFVEATKKSRPDRLVAIVIPEVAEPHWYEYVLDNMHGEALRAMLNGDERTIVITVPWRLRTR